MAKIQLNGKKVVIKSNYSILDLLKKYKLSNKRIAIEYNGTIIQKVNILNSFAEFNDEGFFKLVFNINAGKRYYFNDFNLNLPVDYDLKDFIRLIKFLNTLPQSEPPLELFPSDQGIS